MRVLDEQHRTRTLRGTALDLGDGCGDVPQRHEGLRDEALRVRRAPLVEHPVVPCPHHRGREVLVFGLEELRPAEAREGREQQLGPYAVFVHRADALVNVVRGGDHVVVAPGVEVVAVTAFAGAEAARVCAFPWKESG